MNLSRLFSGWLNEPSYLPPIPDPRLEPLTAIPDPRKPFVQELQALTNCGRRANLKRSCRYAKESLPHILDVCRNEAAAGNTAAKIGHHHDAAADKMIIAALRKRGLAVDDRERNYTYTVYWL